MIYYIIYEKSIYNRKHLVQMEVCENIFENFI